MSSTLGSGGGKAFHQGGPCKSIDLTPAEYAAALKAEEARGSEVTPRGEGQQMPRPKTTQPLKNPHER